MNPNIETKRFAYYADCSIPRVETARAWCRAVEAISENHDDLSEPLCEAMLAWIYETRVAERLAEGSMALKALRQLGATAPSSPAERAAVLDCRTLVASE